MAVDDDDDLLPNDESPAAIQEDMQDDFAARVDGWQPSDADPVTALLAVNAAEMSVAYDLLREKTDDDSRDWALKVEGVVPIDAYPASSAVTITAVDTNGPYTLDAGTVLHVGVNPQVDVATVNDATIENGDLTVSGVIVQAVDAGTLANGAAGDITLDGIPTWIEPVDGIVLAAPLSDGVDAEDSDALDARIQRRRYRASDLAATPDAVESLALDIPGIARALVREGYDLDDDTVDQPLKMTVWPLDVDGADASPQAVQDLRDELAIRSPTCSTIYVGTATRTTVNVAITVAAKADVDSTALQAAVTAAVAAALSPATFGDPQRGQGLSWEYRGKVHRYQVSAAAATVDDVAYVDALTLNGVDADVTLAGPAPLPALGTCVVTVIEAD